MRRFAALVSMAFCLAGSGVAAQEACAHGMPDLRFDMVLSGVPDDAPYHAIGLDIICDCDRGFHSSNPDCQEAGRLRWYDPEDTDTPKPAFDLNDLDGEGAYVTFPNGMVMALTYDPLEIGQFRQPRLSYKVFDNGHLQGEGDSLSRVMFDSQTQDCGFGPGEAGMIPGYLSVIYPRETAADVVLLAARRGWRTRIGWDDAVGKPLYGGPEPLLACERQWGWEGPRKDHCYDWLDVGPGHELEAIAEINALDPRMCARWDAQGAGGAPPIQIVALPFGSLMDPTAPDPAALSARLDGLFAEYILSDRVQRSGFRVLGAGNLFAARLLAPGHALEIAQSDGFWYQIDFSLSVGLQMGGIDGGLSEEITLTLLDVVEIRAPDGVDRLPQGIIDGGTPLTLIADSIDDAVNPPESGEYSAADALFLGPLLTEDGARMRDWQRLIATKLAQSLGGDVFGGL